MSDIETGDRIDRIVALILTARSLIHENTTCKGGGRVSLLHLITLRFIGDERRTMKEIAGHLAITAPSATSLINGLIRDGVVRREEKTGDRRVVRIVMTPKGKASMKKGVERISRNIRHGLETLTRKEQTELTRILRKTVNHLREK